MSATNFTIDDLTLAYSEEDYKPQRKEPLPGLWFEFKVKEATIEQGKLGHLQVKLVTEALDSSGKPLFKKWVNIPVPVSFGETVAPAWSKGLWLAGVRPLFPQDAPYDRVEKDEVTGQKAYFKGDEELKKGKDFDDALVASNRRIAERARDVAKVWLEHGDTAEVPDFTGQTVFGKTVASKEGKYINVEKLMANAPADAEVVYDAKTAFGR
jgi:hypothetical protein